MNKQRLADMSFPPVVRSVDRFEYALLWCDGEPRAVRRGACLVLAADMPSHACWRIRNGTAEVHFSPAELDRMRAFVIAGPPELDEF